jgi:ABC-type multidrug transport system permease subunit
MKINKLITHTKLNIVSVFFLITAFLCLFNLGQGSSDYDYKYGDASAYHQYHQYNQYKEKQRRIENVLLYVVISAFTISLVSSIISVCIKSNAIGIIMIVLSTICVLCYIGISLLAYAVTHSGVRWH